MRKVELLPTRDCEAGYGPAPRVVRPYSSLIEKKNEQTQISHGIDTSTILFLLKCM